MMTNDSESKPKRTYATPKLVAYGDMASLTKTGTGSQTEGMGGTMIPTFRP